MSFCSNTTWILQTTTLVLQQLLHELCSNHSPSINSLIQALCSSSAKARIQHETSFQPAAKSWLHERLWNSDAVDLDAFLHEFGDPIGKKNWTSIWNDEVRLWFSLMSSMWMRFFWIWIFDLIFLGHFCLALVAIWGERHVYGYAQGHLVFVLWGLGLEDLRPDSVQRITTG